MSETLNPIPSNATNPASNSTGLKNTLTQPAKPQYKVVATANSSSDGKTVVVMIPADLHIDPANPEILEPASVVEQKITGNLERGKRSATNAIVLHMTGGGATGTLDGYDNREKKKFVAGAHFLITKTGKVFQTAKLSYQTGHVGEIRPKGYRPNGDNANTEIKTLLTDSEISVLRNTKISFSAKKKELYALQMIKPYKADLNDKESRFPSNEDTIGIEFEALSDIKTKPKSQANVNYEDLTEKQIESAKKLVKFLKDQYKLTDADIYEHPDISYKTQDEASGTRELVK